MSNHEQERCVRVPERRTQSSAEFIADGVVHGVGLMAGIVGAIVLLTADVKPGSAGSLWTRAVYVFGLLAMLGCSAAYNMMRGNARRGMLRGLDHAAIYIMIAGTYTPFLVTLKGAWAVGMTVAIWTVTATGVILKLTLRNVPEAVSISLYLALGWIGIAAFRPFVDALGSTTLILLAVGGVIYSTGVIFHVLDRLKFSNAIWHGFVLSAAAVHYVAVFSEVRAT